MQSARPGAGAPIEDAGATAPCASQAPSVPSADPSRFGKPRRIRRPPRSAAGRPARVVPIAAIVVSLLALLLAAPAFALPEGRVYEMVSPPFKGGYPVLFIRATSPDGDSVAFFSPGGFNGAPESAVSDYSVPYLAHRSATGWSTAPLMAPSPLLPNPADNDLSGSLDEELVLGQKGTAGHLPDGRGYIFAHPTTAPDVAESWQQIATLTPVALEYGHNFLGTEQASTPDLCHVVLKIVKQDALLREAFESELGEALYVFDRGCRGESSSLVLLALNNKRTLLSGSCEPGLGSALYARVGNNVFNALSADGQETFFSSCVAGSEIGVRSPHQVFLRLGGVRTVEVSRPVGAGVFAGCVGTDPAKTPGEVPCEGAGERAPAEFAGASEDGSRVYFTAPLAAGQPPLVPGASDASTNLYMATIGCPASNPGCAVAEREVTSLTEVSRDPAVGQGADVMGVVRVAPDGRRAYFVAGGDLLSQAQREALEASGRPLPRVGAANLYTYDTASPGQVAFVGDLCSHPELSGSVEDQRCPSPARPSLEEAGQDEDLWTANQTQAQTAGPDGRYLVFDTYAQLAPDDTNVNVDVYRYDAQTGALVRVSKGEDGSDANGNRTVLGEHGEAIGATIEAASLGDGKVVHRSESGVRAITEDGSRIVFRSAEPLSPAAATGQVNAYEWHASPGEDQGRVSIVSTGSSDQGVPAVVISPSGSDIFFITTQGLAPQDTDGAADIYDARLGGGFPAAPAEIRACQGDACQGPLTNTAPQLVPGSASQLPGANFPPPALTATTPVKPTPKPARCKRGAIRKKGRCVKKARRKSAKKSLHSGRSSSR